MQEDHPGLAHLHLGTTDLAARPPYLNYKHLGYKDPPQDHHVLKMPYVYYRLFIPFCSNSQGENLQLNHLIYPYPEEPYYRLTWLIRWVARELSHSVQQRGDPCPYGAIFRGSIHL